jgi:hypothetical protein
MEPDDNISPDANMLISPRGEPTPGALGVFTTYRKVEEIKQLEAARKMHIWEVRATISDHVPLVGGADAALSRQPYHLLRLNENPLRIYLHSGGRNAIYYDLVGDQHGTLTYIAVRVESRLPSNAMLLARKPINALLDVFTRDWNMPLMIQRLELVSPADGAILVTEMLVPQRNGISLGPLGGIIQAVPFASYDALYREALTASSPYYRLLCAWKIYEGTQRLRRWIREECEKRKITERMPGDPKVEQDELIAMGIRDEFAKDIKDAGQLFERLAKERHAIAHFLIEEDDGESHVYLADGGQLRRYAIGSSVLLHYGHRLLEDLRLFCMRHMLTIPAGAMILPSPENRDQFIVRASEYGLE